MSKKRRLGYKDSFTDYLMNEINEDAERTVDDELALTTESQFLVLEVTRDQYFKLFSSAITGADLVYPDEAHDITWTLWRSASVNAQLCQAIADCIANNEDVWNALNDYLATSGQNGGRGSPNSPIGSAAREGNLIPAGALCTDANKYAMSLAVVRQLDRVSEDFLEKIEVITNSAELAVELSDNGGIFSSIPATALETAAWIQDSIAEVYSAAYSAATEEILACAIYCAFDNCTLTYDDIYDAYQDATSISLPDVNDIESVIQFLINVGVSGDLAIVGQFHMLALAILRWGSNWVRLGSFDYIRIAIQDAADEEVTVPASCGCTSEWCQEFDFTANDQGFVVSGGYSGVYSGSSWDAVQSGNTCSMVIQKDFGLGMITMNRYELEFYGGGEGDNAFNGVYTTLLNQIDGHVDQPAAGGTAIYYGVSNDTGIAINIGSNVMGAGTVSRAYKLRVYGDGVNPFGVDNC